MPSLILASTSRYRQELLARLRLPFNAMAPQVDESPLPGEAPAALAERLALAKAQANLGSFVHHFGTRDAYIAELIERLYAPMLARLELDGERVKRAGLHLNAVS